MLERHLLKQVPAKCHTCGQFVKAGDMSCPYCGALRPGLSMGRYGSVLLKIFVVLLLGLFLYVVLVEGS